MGAARALRPVLPGALRLGGLRLVAGPRCARLDFPRAQRLELPDLHRLELHARVARQIDGHPYDVDQRAGRRSEAVAAHQHDVVCGKALRQIAPCAIFVTRRLVLSPKRSAISQTGTSAPMKAPEWITGRSASLVIVKGSTSSACACTTAVTSGRAS